MKVNPSKLNGVRVRSRGYLPHWQLDHAVYFVTYRLADSLPAAVVELLRQEHQRIHRAVCGTGEPSLEQRLEISRLFARSLDQALDRGAGACHLADPRFASLVAENLKFHEGKGHRLLCWCVMPNHVHVVLDVEDGSQLPRIVHRWKSFTATRANQLLGQSGAFWQPEYFDRIVRSEEDLVETMQYVLDNPARAGLKEWPWVWSVLS